MSISTQPEVTVAAVTDEQRFEYLARLAGARIVNFLARRIDPACDAADVYQLVLLTAWQKFDQVPAHDDEAIAWLFAVARHHLMNQRRKNQRRSNALDSLKAHIAVQAGHSVPEHEPVHAAMAVLRRADRELLELVYWDDLTTEQAGQVLGISNATCRARLSRARKRLAKHLPRAT